jgi:hypothetical protein
VHYPAFSALLRSSLHLCLSLPLKLLEDHPELPGDADVEFKVKTVHMPAAVEPDGAVRVGIPSDELRGAVAMIKLKGKTVHGDETEDKRRSASRRR